jgi:hypothetical protein
MSTTTTIENQHEKAPAGGIYLALAPWVAFSLLSEHVSVKAAAVAALAAGIAIAIPSIARRRPKTLELAAIAAFAAIAVAAFTLDPSGADWLARYARALAAGMLALIAFGSLLFTPFTEQYARESVPRRLWGAPQFTRINRTLTRTWGLVFLGMVPCHVIAGLVDTSRSNLIFNWVLPVALVVWGVKRTSAITDSASAKA